MFMFMKGMRKIGQITCLYREAVSASSCRSFDYGVWRGFFYQSKSGDVSHIKCAVCSQSVRASDGGNGDNYHALCVYSSADSYFAEKLSPYPADAASGSAFFGYLTDFGVWAVQEIHCGTYWQQWLVCLAGILLVAAGVSLEVKAGVVVLAGEGVVLAVCKAFPKVRFGYMKVGFDVTLVVTACILSFIFTGRLQGVREGTVAAALMVGLLAKQFGKLLTGWKLEGGDGI